jgi:transposase
MQNIAGRPEASTTTICTNLDAIFVSLELSRSTWLVTSLLPGGGDRMSRHSVPGGDFAAVPVHGFETPICAYAATDIGPI